MKTPFLTVPTMIWRLAQPSAHQSVTTAASQPTDYSKPVEYRADEGDEVVMLGQISAHNLPAHPGEIALRAAILERAINDLDLGCDYSSRDRDVRNDALRWIKSPDENDPFSFPSVCQALGIDPTAAQQALVARAESMGERRKLRWNRKTATR